MSCVFTAMERNNLMRLAHDIPFTPVSIFGDSFGCNSHPILSLISLYFPWQRHMSFECLSLFSHGLLLFFPHSSQEVRRWASTLWRKYPLMLTLNSAQSLPGPHEACLQCCSPSPVRRALWMGGSGRAAGFCVPGQKGTYSHLVWYMWSKPSGQRWFALGRGTSMEALLCSFV